jgi:hypothetical protein
MNLYLPIANLRVFQKGPEFFGIKVYNNLSGRIKQLSNNKKKFREVLLLFLYFHSFYNMNLCRTASVVWWSEFLATDPETRVLFPALLEKKGNGSGTGSTQPREYT